MHGIRLSLLSLPGCALALAGVAAHGQDEINESLPPPPPLPPDTLMFVAGSGPVLPLGGSVQVVGAAGSVVGEVVAGKPYSAESVTESTQILGDGNRIVHTNRARIYRDSAGRTRREQSIAALGVWSPGEAPLAMVTIHDPVEEVTYFLDPKAQTARALKPFRFELTRPAFADGASPANVVVATRPAEAGVVVHDDGDRKMVVRRLERAPLPTPGEPLPFEVPVPPPGAGAGVRFGVAAAVAPPFATLGFDGPTEVDDLGEQVLEGVLARGSRETRTIPAGTIGNERPIEIVTEQWYSEELDALLLRRTSDPRFGETTYRLIGVARGEPSPDLFEVPEGYRLVEDEPPLANAEPGVPGRRGERRLFLVQPGATP